MGLAAPDGASSSWSRLAVDGCTSTGATMTVAQPGHRCCGGCVNIYVNNNVQGVTNSVLLGSKVVMRDPGARVYNRRPRRGGRRVKQQQNKTALKTTGIIILLVAAALCLVLMIHGIRRLN
ncbi:hypothetical protein QOZ80_5AG0382380 [Eleusine coracana subsp. coracana]|nr:hypothetical protein QOZ80_5AG0382380 [Eleusine coracana subsp. coracana]